MLHRCLQVSNKHTEMHRCYAVFSLVPYLVYISDPSRLHFFLFRPYLVPDLQKFQDLSLDPVWLSRKKWLARGAFS